MVSSGRVAVANRKNKSSGSGGAARWGQLPAAMRGV